MGGGRGRRQVTGPGAGRTARDGGGEAAGARGFPLLPPPHPPRGNPPPWKIKSVKAAVLGFPGSGAAPARVWRCRSTAAGAAAPAAACVGRAAPRQLPNAVLPAATSQRGGSGAPPRGQRAPRGKGPEQIPCWGCAVPWSGKLFSATVPFPAPESCEEAFRSFSPLREQTRKGSGVSLLRGEPAGAGPV